MSLAFRPGIDNEADTFIDLISGVKYAHGYICWMIMKGERFAENRTETIETSLNVDTTSSLPILGALYAFAQTGPAMKISSGQSEEHVGNPFLLVANRSAGVYQVGVIEVDMSGVELSMYRPKVFEGRKYYDVPIRVILNFGAEEGVLKMKLTTSAGAAIGEARIHFTSHQYY
ncbi:Hsp70 family protein [Penicillium hispanicum]|uniref:Hsp70 family protein n=1 Tax=Penicillium hispanicum TaxID=1080232 RepID=UPI0025412A21|nr:Hsp70 family protein [Penicillium hispanicum]KAJ5587553.1 Hsp70 family protein [Penicillium hispanicum]